MGRPIQLAQDNVLGGRGIVLKIVMAGGLRKSTADKPFLFLTKN